MKSEDPEEQTFKKRYMIWQEVMRRTTAPQDEAPAVAGVLEGKAAYGKPSETMGRKARGCRPVFLLRPRYARSVAWYHGKPSETAGRKVRG